MAIRYVYRIDNPEEKKVLKTRCRPIKLPDRRLKQLIADMFETMYAHDGVGLAAPQIGLNIRLVVIGIPASYEKQEDGTEIEVEPAEEYVLINPRIVKYSKEEIVRNEGCLSLPGWYGDVPRSEWVTIEYQELNGKQRRLRKIGGSLGWIAQHEIDHLEGVLFTERIQDLSTLRDIRKEQAEAIQAAQQGQQESEQQPEVQPMPEQERIEV
jgi:peptide deformylase